MRFDGKEFRLAHHLSWRRANPELDKDLDGNPVGSPYVAIVFKKDCPIVAGHLVTEMAPSIPMDSGGTNYGYGKPRTRLGHCTRTIYLVKDNRVYTATIPCEKTMETGKKILSEKQPTDDMVLVFTDGKPTGNVLTENQHKIAELDKRCFLPYGSGGKNMAEVAAYNAAHAAEWNHGNALIMTKWSIGLDEWYYIREVMRVQRLKALDCKVGG